MKHLFIVNPAAGKGNRCDDLVRTIHAEAGKRALDYEIHITVGKGDAEQTARAWSEAHSCPLRIYVLGGDGTLNEVVNGAAGFDHCAVTALPLGSGNDFLKIFGEGQSRFLSLPALLDGPEEAEFDLIECNGRLALNICSVGLDARIGLGMSAWKKLPFVRGNGAYVLSAISEILQGIAKPCRITLPQEDEVLDGSFTLICVCNGRAYGGCFYPCPSAMPDDGVLHFIIIPKLNILTVAKLIGHYAAGRVSDYRKYVRLYDGASLRIETPKPYRMELDGEELVSASFSVALSAKKLRFFFPAGVSYAPTDVETMKTGVREMEHLRV